MAAKLFPKNSKMRKDFSKLKELRSNKQKNTFQDNDLAPIYDEVTEMEYNQIAKRALLEDDFIVDDNGQGYVGRGLEDWDTKQESSESDISDLDQDDTKKVRKSPKVKKRKIQDLFNGLKKTTTTVKKEVLPQKKDQDILGDILMDLDNDLVAKTGDIDQKFKQKKLSSTQANPRFSEMGSFNNANVVIKNEFSQYGEVKIKSEFPETDNNFGSTMDDFHNSDDDDDFVNEIKVKQEYPEVVVKKEVVLQAPKIAKIQAKKLSSQANQKFLPQFIKKEEVDLPVVLEQSQSKSNWSELKDKFQVQAGVIDELPAETSGYYESSDSTTYFYYLDCYEKKGKVYLFGKVFDNNRYVSCCLTINNMERNLFLLPKQNSDVTMMDVYQEFDVLRKKMGISNFKSKPVERNYCFELPGIPSKAEYLKVVYSFSEPELPMDFSGKTFTKVFGTNTKALELFLIKRKIMGPCWLKINGALRSSKHISFCNLELQIESPKSVSVVGNDGEDGVPKEAPPLVVMSLNLRTLMNLEKSTNEIVLCGILIYQNGKN